MRLRPSSGRSYPWRARRARRPPRSRAPRCWCAAEAAAGPSLALVDLAAGGGERVPLGAEVLQALAGGVAGLLVAGVEVERVAVVGHLALAARGGDGGELAGERSARRGDGAGGQRRPGAQAGARAVALVRRIGLEEVEGAAVAVHEDLAERGAADVDGRLGCGGTSRRAVAGRPAGVVGLGGATAGRDGEDADSDGDEDDEGDEPGHESASLARGVEAAGWPAAYDTPEDDPRPELFPRRTPADRREARRTARVPMAPRPGYVGHLVLDLHGRRRLRDRPAQRPARSRARARDGRALAVAGGARTQPGGARRSSGGRPHGAPVRGRAHDAGGDPPARSDGGGRRAGRQRDA